jgi:hypothetical protein
MKRKYELGHSPLDCLIGISPASKLMIRDEPRPAVAPFSATESNGMMDEEERIHVGYPPELPEEEDEVMMDFVSGR